MSVVTFTAPAQIHQIFHCSRWNLGELPEDCDEVVIDLRRWRTVNAASAVSLVATLAKLCQRGLKVTVWRPKNDYADRMLTTIGFADALRTFTELDEPAPRAEPVRRILPILTVKSFRTESEVEAMAEELPELFFDKGLSRSLVQDTATVLAEAANNVVHHAESPVGGFAIVQQRYMQFHSKRAQYIEIAVADPGQGIATSLGHDPSDAAPAIADAVQEGTTSTGHRHRGIGLYEVEQTVMSGALRVLWIHSDNGVYAAARVLEGSESFSVANRFPGTVVTVIMGA
jgi:anti-sigma regulatory factor (Ser/Thr protein kinase)